MARSKLTPDGLVLCTVPKRMAFGPIFDPCQSPATHLVTLPACTTFYPHPHEIPRRCFPACGPHKNYWEGAPEITVEPITSQINLQLVLCNNPACPYGGIADDLLCPACHDDMEMAKLPRKGSMLY